MATYKFIENGVFTNRIVMDDPANAPEWTLLLDDGHGDIGDLWNGSVFSKAPDPVKVQVNASNAIQHLLDTTAQAHGYDNILSLCSYVNSTNLTWQKEGQYGCNFRDACWNTAEKIQDAVLAGTRPLPSVDEVLAEMPPIAWPT